MIPLPQCRWRGEEHLGRFGCSSTKLVGNKTVTAEFCGKVCPYADHVPEAPKARPQTKPPATPIHLPTCNHLGPIIEYCSCGNPLKNVHDCPIHDKCVQGDWKGRNPAIASCATCKEHTTMKWAYGVTTCLERVKTTLPRTLASLAKGGFDRPRLFVDGATEMDVPYLADYEKTCRFPAIRIHGNWVLALHELWIRNPAADRYAIFQDDIACVQNLRAYLDLVEYPAKGYLNLFTFRDNEPLIIGKKGFVEAAKLQHPKGGLTGRGALGLVFDRAALKALLVSDHLALRPGDGSTDINYRKIDGGVADSMWKAGFTEYVHAPSLLQHMGELSTIRLVTGDRKPSGVGAMSFPGESVDALIWTEPGRTNPVH